MTKTNVYVFLFNGFSDWEISYVTPELEKSEKVNLNYFSIDGKSIKSMGGLNITPDYSIDQINASQISVVILPGGTAWENDLVNGINELIERLFIENKTIAAICGATTYLARKGYLDNLAHTSNDLSYLSKIAKKYKGADNYKNKLAVTDKNLITANGIGAIEFAREIFRKVELYNENDLEKWFHLFKNGVWVE